MTDNTEGPLSCPQCGLVNQRSAEDCWRCKLRPHDTRKPDFQAKVEFIRSVGKSEFISEPVAPAVAPVMWGNVVQALPTFIPEPAAPVVARTIELIPVPAAPTIAARGEYIPKPTVSATTKLSEYLPESAAPAEEDTLGWIENTFVGMIKGFFYFIFWYGPRKIFFRLRSVFPTMLRLVREGILAAIRATVPIIKRLFLFVFWRAPRAILRGLYSTLLTISRLVRVGFVVAIWAVITFWPVGWWVALRTRDNLWASVGVGAYVFIALYGSIILGHRFMRRRSGGKSAQ